jgi:tRNA(Ile)-lysidine synthase TilS/MesJ
MVTNDQLEELLGRIFDGAREGLRESIEPDDYAQRRRDFIFHMTDWKSEVRQLADLYKNPKGHDELPTSDFLIGFLYHVIPHLNAAGRLLLDEVLDTFADPANEKTASNRRQADDVASGATSTGSVAPSQ